MLDGHLCLHNVEFGLVVMTRSVHWHIALGYGSQDSERLEANVKIVGMVLWGESINGPIARCSNTKAVYMRCETMLRKDNYI